MFSRKQDKIASEGTCEIQMSVLFCGAGSETGEKEGAGNLPHLQSLTVQN